MNRKFIVVVGVSTIMLGAGVALAASQTPSISSACVNDVNGLMRASENCREGEHSVSIGGGGSNVAVTQNGSFTIAANSSGGAKTLPLTGATVSGRCDTFTTPGGDAVTARILVEAPVGKTMDFFPADFNGSPTGVTSKLLAPAGSQPPGGGTSSDAKTAAIFTVNRTTATLTIGGAVDGSSKACTFLWQAFEVPN